MSAYHHDPTDLKNTYKRIVGFVSQIGGWLSEGMALHLSGYNGFSSHTPRYIPSRRHPYINSKKPRHTPESRKEATRRERIRVKALSQAYYSLQQVIPFDSNTKITYLSILRGAVAYIKALEMILGIREDILATSNRKRGRECKEEKENQEEKSRLGNRLQQRDDC